MRNFKKNKSENIKSFVNKAKTAEEYRKAAENHRKAAKNMRTTFLKTGVFMLSAAVVIIVMTIAWFMSNNKVGASGTNINANNSERYIIASAGNRQKAEQDNYKENGENILSDSEGSEYTNYYDTLTGETVTLQEDKKLTLYNGTVWHLQDHDTMHPGARGVLEFYVIPQVENLQELTFSFDVAAYKAVNDVNNPVSLVEDEVINQLLEGHILFFTNLDDSDGYSGWIGTNEKKITVKDKNGTLQKNLPYKVSIYWIWPRKYRNFIYHQKSMQGDLFATESEDYKQLISFINKNQAKFFYNNSEEMKGITTDINMSDDEYVLGTSYYNIADEYIGTNVNYIYLEINL